MCSKTSELSMFSFFAHPSTWLLQLGKSNLWSRLSWPQIADVHHPPCSNNRGAALLVRDSGLVLPRTLCFIPGSILSPSSCCLKIPLQETRTTAGNHRAQWQKSYCVAVCSCAFFFGDMLGFTQINYSPLISVHQQTYWGNNSRRREKKCCFFFKCIILFCWALLKKNPEAKTDNEKRNINTSGVCLCSPC